MKNEKLACLGLAVVFLLLAGAAGALVYRRAGSAGAAVLGGIVGGVLLMVALSWLAAIPGRIHEAWLILRARLGGSPRDGRRAAIIGHLRGHGELAAPFSGERCLLYEYEIVTTERKGRSATLRKAFEGFAMVPLFVEHGHGRARILAKPKLPQSKTNRPDAIAAAGPAKRFIDATAFSTAPERSEERDLSHTDGRLRYDYRRGDDEPVLHGCVYMERLLSPDAEVCAIGRFHGEREALLAPVTIRTGSTFATNAAWRVVNAAVASAAFAALAVAAALLFAVHFPLDAMEQSRPSWTPRWWEVDLERSVERYLRTPMTTAGILDSQGFRLQEVCSGCAHGRLEIAGRKIELRHAAYRGKRTVHLSADQGGRDGVTLIGDERVLLTIDGRSADVPPGWLQPRDIETSLGSDGDYAGRVTIMAPDRSIRCRAHFNAPVDEDDWLPGDR